MSRKTAYPALLSRTHQSTYLCKITQELHAWDALQHLICTYARIPKLQPCTSRTQDPSMLGTRNFSDNRLTFATPRTPRLPKQVTLLNICRFSSGSQRVESESCRTTGSHKDATGALLLLRGLGERRESGCMGRRKGATTHRMRSRRL